MKISFSTNVAVLKAQSQLNQATSKVDQNITRLSSGLRINKAADDSAGLSVATSLNTNQKIANRGVRNLNDGISYLNVADGAISELSNIATRISELATQSANGTSGETQRGAMQTEVTALQSEYNRIIKTTAFNGKQLLTGDQTNTSLQGWHGANGQLATQIGDAAISGAPDNAAGLTVRVSVSSSGTQSNNTSSNTGARISISADGRYVAFKSVANNLVPGDAF